MANTTITKILVRRGPEVDRENIIPTMGEPIFTTDTHRFYIGDGEVSGGQPVVDIDPSYFIYKRVDPNDNQIKDLPPGSNGVDHHVISINPNQTGDIKTSGRIITTNNGTGCSADYNNGAALIVENGGLYCNGNINCNADVVSFCTSDVKFKDNIRVIDNPLELIDRVSGVTYEWNDKQDTYTGPDTGLIAQELENLGLPGIVTDREDGTKAVKYERVIPLLIECVKQLSKHISGLEDQINGTSH